MFTSEILIIDFCYVSSFSFLCAILVNPGFFFSFKIFLYTLCSIGANLCMLQKLGN